MTLYLKLLVEYAKEKNNNAENLHYRIHRASSCQQHFVSVVVSK